MLRSNSYENLFFEIESESGMASYFNTDLGKQVRQTNGRRHPFDPDWSRSRIHR